jgi:hypothetical protein
MMRLIDGPDCAPHRRTKECLPLSSRRPGLTLSGCSDEHRARILFDRYHRHRDAHAHEALVGLFAAVCHALARRAVDDRER